MHRIRQSGYMQGGRLGSKGCTRRRERKNWFQEAKISRKGCGWIKNGQKAIRQILKML